MIHLDTNVVIAMLGNRPGSVRARLDEALAAGSPICRLGDQDHDGYVAIGEADNFVLKFCKRAQ
jgi:hypothetical protein